MEIEIEGGLRVKLNQNDNTSSIIESPKASGTVFIPKFVEYENQKYKIISIGDYAFNANKSIDYLTFPEDSEVERFERCFLQNCNINKLQIPPKLKYLGHGWASGTTGLNTIEVSPKNKYFKVINKLLLGKSQEDSDIFDVLYYAACDIVEVVIPPQVKIVKEYCFCKHKQLKCVMFADNSKLESIGFFAFNKSTIQRLSLPESLKKLNESCFSDTENLTEIEISPKNEYYSLSDGTYLLGKSGNKSNIYDILIFARRDIESAVIPSHIRIINNYAFDCCSQLRSIAFEPNSSLERIDNAAFSCIPGQEKIVIPPSVTYIDSNSFFGIKNLKTIEFLGKSLSLHLYCFSSCKLLSVISFPNAESIEFGSGSMSGISKDVKVFVRHDAKLTGNDLEESRDKINFIDEIKDDHIKKGENIKGPNEQKQNDEMKDLKDYVSYLQSQLHKFTSFLSFEEFLKERPKPNSLKEDGIDFKDEKPKEETDFIIGPEDEEHHEIISKIGEGATSDV